MNKSLKLLLVFFAIFAVCFSSCDKQDANSNNAELPAQVRSNQIVEHYAFTLCYNEQHEQADWVAYELTSEEASAEDYGRSDDFREDPEISTESAQLDDYKYSGYDRGHLIPAADNKWSKTAMSESFYLSNMSPQINAFNGGKWKFLEMQVREWAISYGSVHVAVGPVLQDGLETIGDNEISVPEFYYKVILDTQGQKGIGFLMPHQDIEDSFKNYAVTIDEVESTTGIDFFYQLDDKTEEKVESELNLSQWKFDYY